MHQELYQHGLEEWWTSDQSGQSGIYGCATFNTFENAFKILTKGSSVERVNFQHRWYSNWSWIAAENKNVTFFEEMNEKLNDDCIRKVVEYIGNLHLIYLAHLNERFQAIVEEKMIRTYIFPSTVGSIGLINFRYFLEMFKDSTKEIFLSLNAFPSTYGFYFEHIKRYILEIVYSCTGTKLKTIYLYDFNLTQSETKNFDHILRLFLNRNIEVKFK